MKKEHFKDIGVTLFIFLMLSFFVILLNYNTSGIGRGKAFRSSADINIEPVYLDNEAIALADSLNDANLRSVALEANTLVNEIRADAGLNTLKWDSNLETVANVRANEISAKFSHTRPNGRQWYTVNSKIQGGENLAFGFNTAEDVVDAWMNSPTHRDNILYDDFKKVAISIYEEDGTYYIAQEYGY